ncbi:MAG: STAS/SEC14 domain-containing protein [Anaerolineales bacterium]|jgi:hypothetical protein
MPDFEEKPLNWKPDPNVGYSVTRRADGGMNLTFTDAKKETLQHWHEFASEHLLGSDRLTRNLYDLRQVEEISEDAIQIAIELNADPSSRNIRLAVVVSTERVKLAMQNIADLTPAGGVRMAIFEEIDQAEAWLSRPMELMV